MTTVPCPGCAKPLALNEEVCPHCRRPRDEKEIENGLEAATREHRRLKERPRRLMVLAAAVLAGAGGLALAWNLRGAASASARAGWAGFLLEVESARGPGAEAKPVMHPEPVNPAPPAPPAKPAEPAAPAVPVEVPDAAPATAPQPRAWALSVYGVVYNAATNKPVSGAMVQFQSSKSGAHWAVGTDSAGHYAITLHKDDMTGMTTVTIEAPGYRKGLLEDQTPPYRERSPEARAALVAETSDSDLEPVPVRYPDSAQVVELDLVLIPEQKNIK